MTEIMEKAMIIGFGLVVTISFLSFITPLLNIIFYNEKIQNFNGFCSLFREGLIKVEEDEQYTFNYFLLEELNIHINRISNKSQIVISSQFKNYTLNNNNEIKPKFLKLNLNISLLLLYDDKVITIINKGEL